MFRTSDAAYFGDGRGFPTYSPSSAVSGGGGVGDWIAFPYLYGSDSYSDDQAARYEDVDAETE